MIVRTGALEADTADPAPEVATWHARPRVRLALAVLLVCAGYYGAGVVALMLRLEPGGISTIWLPHGVLLAALMLTPVRRWWLYLVALLPVHLHLVSHFQGPVPLGIMLIQYGGNIAQAVLGALAARSVLGTPPRLNGLRRMAVFLGLGLILPMMAVSAVVGALFLFTDWVDNFWLAWHRRTLTGICGAVALTPLIIRLAAIRATNRPATGWRYLEFVGLTLVLLVLASSALRWEDSLAIQYALLFAPLALLLWTAVRFGPGALSLHLLIITLAVLIETKSGHTPFAAASVARSVLSAQGFLLSLSIPLLLLAALVAERNRSARALDERLAFERLVSDLSASLVNPPLGQVDKAVEKALHRVLVAMKFDRCSVFEYRASERCCRITHSAQSAGSPPVRHEMTKAELPWLLRQLRGGVTVVLNDVARDLPVEATAERRYAEAYGSRSWLAVPFTVGKDVVHGVSYHSITRRDWPADLVSRLQLLARIFISSLTGKQASDALRENDERLRLALAAGHMGVWDWDLVRGTDTWSREYFRIMGLAPFGEAPSPQLWASLVHPDDLARANAAMQDAIVQRTEYRCDYRFVLPDGSFRWVEARGQPFYDEAGRCVRVSGLTVDITERKRAEEALRASEEQYHAIFNATADGLTLRDDSFRLVDVNPALLAMTGFTRDEVLGSDRMLFTPPERQAMARQILARALGGETTQYETEAVRKDGTRFAVEVRRVPLLYRGRPHVFILTRDITERKRAEQALRESEEQYHAIFIATADGLTLRDRNFRIVDVNPALLAMTGFAREEVLGSDRMLFTPPEHRGATRELFRRELAGEPTRYEMEAVRKDGTRFSVEVRGVPLQYRGEPHVLVIARDITERRRAEAALQASEERYREVVESQTDLVCRYLPDTTLTFVNEAYCRFFGRPREELIGRRFVELIPEPARPAVLDQVASLVREPRVYGYEHEVLLADGTVRWQHWVDSPIFAADGRLAELQGIGRDITDRKRADEAYRKLIHASRLAVVGELTASIAHEINQPLGAILANADAAELLLETGPGRLDEVRRALADIRRDDLRASEVIRRIRALLRDRELERQPLDVNEIAAGVLQLLDAEAARRGVAVKDELASRLPAVRGDRVHLQQVLLNLILNAMDAMAHTPAGERRLAVRTACGAGLVEVEVMDRGHGLDPARLPHLFDSFYTTKADGMGLGLSIARSIVEAHGGRIWAENRAGGGAAFRFTLPAEPAT